MAFSMDNYRLATVRPEEIEACERRWPEACWVRFGDEVIFFRRASGVALVPFMAALRDAGAQAATVTLAVESRRRGYTADTLPTDPLDALPLDRVAKAVPGAGSSFAVYRSHDGQLDTRSRVIFQRGGETKTIEGPIMPIETG